MVETLECGNRYLAYVKVSGIVTTREIADTITDTMDSLAMDTMGDDTIVIVRREMGGKWLTFDSWDDAYEWMNKTVREYFK